MKFELWQAFVLGTVLSWGIYVPVLHEGQAKLGGGSPSAGSLRAFLCVGIAYLITAVIIPLLLFWLNLAAGEQLDFTRDGELNTGGLAFATLGGIAGSAGALCIVLALKYGGRPLYVVPLVFAGAPIVGSIVSLLWHPPEGATESNMLPGWIMFGAGILLAAVGAGLVLYSKSYIELESKKRAMQKKAATVVAQAGPGSTAS